MTLKEAIDKLRWHCWHQRNCEDCKLEKWCRDRGVKLAPSTWPRLEE